MYAYVLIIDIGKTQYARFYNAFNFVRKHWRDILVITFDLLVITFYLLVISYFSLLICNNLLLTFKQ